jgi:hypothetical protein
LGYQEELVANFWRYVQSHPGLAQYLDEAVPKGTRPPVFAAGHSESNVIFAPETSPQIRAGPSRHATDYEAPPVVPKHVELAGSRQILVRQPHCARRTGVLADIATESGEPLVGATIESAKLEHAVDHLGECRTVKRASTCYFIVLMGIVSRSNAI